MRNITIGTAAGIIAAAMTCGTDADVLVASFNDSGSGGTSSIITNLNVELVYELFDDEYGIAPTQALGVADIGSAFDLVGPDLPTVIEQLTNGIDQELTVWVGNGGTGSLESFWFDDWDFDAPDLAEFDISRIEVFVNAMTFDSPGSDPNGDGNWTDYTYSVTFNFYEVPGPGVLALFALAVPYGLRRRRRADG